MHVRLNEISNKTLEVENVKKALGSFGNVEDQSTFGHVSKFAFRLEDKSLIEGLLIGTFPRWVYRFRNLGNKLNMDGGAEKLLQRRTHYDVCISTQVGCAVDCEFCASSLLPFRRSLTLDEMLAQLETLRQALPAGSKLQRVFYSGIGEPLLNYEAVTETARYLLARHYIPSTINTSGIIPAMEDLMAERLPVNLIVSIHAPNNELRQKLIPITKTYPLEDIVAVLKKAPDWMFVEVKYLMLNGVNDSVEHARELAELLRGLEVVVTLQSYNRIAERDYEQSPHEAIRKFAQTLREHGYRVGFLNSNIGEPVEGGCGQMRMNDEMAAPKRRRSKAAASA